MKPIDVPECPYKSSYWRGCICNACLAYRTKMYKRRLARTIHTKQQNRLQAKVDYAMTEHPPAELDYAALCTPHRRSLVLQAIRFTGLENTAEDLVQDTYVRAHTYWTQFQPTTDNTSRDVLMWLRRIMANIFYTQCNKEKRKYEALNAYGEELSLSENEDTAFAPKTRELIAHLRPDYKAVIELHYIDGLSYQEMADTLEITFTKVQKRLWRARNELKEMLMKAGVVSQASP